MSIYSISDNLGLEDTERIKKACMVQINRKQPLKTILMNSLNL